MNYLIRHIRLWKNYHCFNCPDEVNETQRAYTICPEALLLGGQGETWTQGSASRTSMTLKVLHSMLARSLPVSTAPTVPHHLPCLHLSEPASSLAWTALTCLIGSLFQHCPCANTPLYSKQHGLFKTWILSCFSISSECFSGFSSHLGHLQSSPRPRRPDKICSSFQPHFPLQSHGTSCYSLNKPFSLSLRTSVLTIPLLEISTQWYSSVPSLPLGHCSCQFLRYPPEDYVECTPTAPSLAVSYPDLVFSI